MKTVKIMSLSSVLLITIPVVSQAANFNVFAGYRSAHQAYETRMKISNSWENGLSASLETDTWNSIHSKRDANGKLPKGANGILSLNYQEMDINYGIKLNDQWSLRPGVLSHWDQDNGLRLGPYLKLAWDVTKNLNLGIRYRYDFNVKHPEAPVTHQSLARKDQHRYDGYVTYKIDDKWTAAWQTTLYSRVHSEAPGYIAGSSRRWATENAFVVLYKLTPTITPYIEYDYLDRQGPKGTQDNSYRVGVSYTF